MSDPNFWLNVLMRWLHVGAAIVGLGAFLFLLWVLVPALRGAPGADDLHDRLGKPLKRLVHSAVGVLLLTGFYNYIGVAIPALRTERYAGIKALYHPAMGGKILLSVFFIVVAILYLTPPARERKGGLLSVLAVLGLVILAIASYLRRVWNLA